MAHVVAKLFVLNATLCIFVLYIGLVPTILMVASVDDQDVAFFHFHPLGDHLWRIEAVVRDGIGNIHYHTFATEVGKRNIGDGSCTRVEGTRPNQVGSGVVTPLDNLPIGPLPTTPGAGQP